MGEQYSMLVIFQYSFNFLKKEIWEVAGQFTEI